MYTNETKLFINGEAVPVFCPKCNGENSLYAVSAMKWGKVNKWQHFSKCELCTYESKVK